MKITEINSASRSVWAMATGVLRVGTRSPRAETQSCNHFKMSSASTVCTVCTKCLKSLLQIVLNTLTRADRTTQGRTTETKTLSHYSEFRVQKHSSHGLLLCLVYRYVE